MWAGLTVVGVVLGGRASVVWAGPRRLRSDGSAMAAPEQRLRRRKAGVTDEGPASAPAPGRDLDGYAGRLREGTFWLTRIVLLRALAFVYSESAGTGLPPFRGAAVWPRPPPGPAFPVSPRVSGCGVVPGRALRRPLPYPAPPGLSRISGGRRREPRAGAGVPGLVAAPSPE